MILISRNIILCALGLCSFLGLSGQSGTPLQKYFILSSNYSSFSEEKVLHHPVLSPAFGFQLKKGFSPNWGLRTRTLFFQKRSKYNSAYAFQRRGADLQLAIDWVFDDFVLYAGANYEWVYSNQVLKVLDGFSSQSPNYNLSNPQELNWIIGCSFKLNPKMDFFFNWVIPSQANNSQNFQAGLSFPIVRNSDRKVKRISERRARINRTKDEIQRLKNGVLLLRLQTMEPGIQALRERGMVDEADKVEENQKDFNLNLVKSLRKEYKFSRLEFFYSYHSPQVKNKELKGIFLNDSLQLDTSIKVNPDEEIFTASFRQIDRDTTSHFAYQNFYSQDPSKAAEVFYGGPDFKFNALVLMNDQFEQLHKPFPYYTRLLNYSLKSHATGRILQFPFLWHKKYDFDRAIRTFNWKLESFYRWSWD